MGCDLSEPALIWTGKVMLEGRVAVPHAPVGAVVLAAAPALRNDARDEHIVAALFEVGIATVHAPLLESEESRFDDLTAQLRHDTDFLASRFIDLAQWLGRNRLTSGLPLSFIASGAGAPGALIAAAQRPDLVTAAVSIDGRTDLAVDALRLITCPTLLVVNDLPVLRMNREALTRIKAEKRLEIVHGSGDEAALTVAGKVVHWLTAKSGALVAQEG
jgi:putative phosphoribosyl transferase